MANKELNAEDGELGKGIHELVSIRCGEVRNHCQVLTSMLEAG